MENEQQRKRFSIDGKIRQKSGGVAIQLQRLPSSGEHGLTTIRQWLLALVKRAHQIQSSYDETDAFAHLSFHSSH